MYIYTDMFTKLKYIVLQVRQFGYFGYLEMNTTIRYTFCIQNALTYPVFILGSDMCNDATKLPEILIFFLQ